MMFRKKIPWMIVFVLIAGLSIWTVMTQSRSFSFEVLKDQLMHVNPLYMALAIISMTGFIVFEGLAVSCIVEGLSGLKRHKEGLLYGAADVYFSAITPSASGGQPASAFFMIRDGIPVATTTVTLLVNLIMYTYALLVCGLIAVLFEWRSFFSFPFPGRLLIIAGSIAMAGLSFVFWILLKKDSIIEKTILFFILIGERLHIVKNGDALRASLYYTMHQYRECAEAIKGKKKMLWMAFFLNLMQRLSQSLVTVFSYLALGGEFFHSFRVWCIHLLCTLGYNSIPLPGAVGVADYLLIEGFDQIPDVTNAANLELVCRGLSFYLCISISLIIVICGYLRRERRKKQ